MAVASLLLVAAPAAARAQEPAGERFSLARSIQVALANSRTLEAAELDLRIAGQQVRDAWSAVLPELTATASYSRNLQVQEAFLPAIIFDPTASPSALVPVRFGSDNTWRAGLSFDQALFDARVFIGVGAAGRYHDLQAERVRGTAQEVVTAVRLAYFDALLAEEEVRLTRNSIARVRQTLAETRAMNRAGLASDYDVLRLEVQLGNLEPNLQRAVNALAAAKRRLLVELGRDPEQEVALEGSLSTIVLGDLAANDAGNAALLSVAGDEALVSQPFEELLRAARAQRSDLRQQEAGLMLEEARHAAEKAEYLPKLRLFSTYDVTAQENGRPSFFGETSNQRTTATVAGLRIEVPIFTGFSRQAKVSEAGARVRQSEVVLDRLERQAASGLRTALETVGEARDRAEAQRRAVAQAQRGFEIASAEYNAGLGSQLQITDAEVALRESEFNYARAVYDYLAARARLEAAAGAVPDRAGALAQERELR
jgi:outer membrane protein TolC